MPVPSSHLSEERTGTRDSIVALVGLDHRGQLGLVDLLVALEQLATALGLELLRRQAPDQVLVRLAVLEQRHLDEVLRLAVGLVDDHVLGDVDQAPRQVARVGRPQRRVREALAGAVGRDEVLEHRQALHEVGLDRALDDLALRVGHQAAHAGELADLLERSARSRVGHHEDRVELVEVALHRLGDLVGRRVPQVGRGLLALLGGDPPLLVLADDVGGPLLVALEDLLLVGRRDDVVLGHGDPRLGGVVEAELLERVEHQRDRRGAVGLDERGDHVVDVALLQRVVDELELRPGRTRPPAPRRAPARSGR